MPCYTVQTVGVVLKVSDLDLLRAAIKSLGMVPAGTGQTIYFGNGESFDKERGELRVTSQERAALIKRAYSAEVVKSQARRFGWHLKQTGEYQYEVMKR